METNFIDSIDLSDIKAHHDWQIFLTKAKLRVLFVTDGNLSQLDTVYEYMHGKVLGCTRISVKRAVYGYSGEGVVIDDSPADGQPHYANFKFNSTKSGGQKILDDFDVMYIFAVNSGSPTNMNDEELSALHEWMNAGHGVFATGDHSTLGQRLASRIPRVGTMRKWTEEDEVPPGTTEKRIDTNQPDPSNPGQLNGTAVIPNSAQSDEFPQKITVLPFRKVPAGPLREIHYPHEILCHPQHGKFNVMPDHPQEGECFRPRDITIDAKVRFETEVDNDDEYPKVSGSREHPRIIARGRNSHEYDLEKGEVDPYVFDMISVYDGYKANVGRVVVDSTWHHWYGMNIDDIKDAGGENWAKIGRYFLNIAKYLAPEGLYKNRCTWDIIDAQFDYPFVEEFVWDKTADNIYDIGVSFHESLTRRIGNCGTIQLAIYRICEYKPWLCELLERETLPGLDPRDPSPVCLSCPPIDVLIKYALGGIAIQTADIRESVKARFSGKAHKCATLDTKDIDQQIDKGVAFGVDEFLKHLSHDINQTEKIWLNRKG